VPVEAKPLFRPDVLRSHQSGFQLPDRVEAIRPRLDHWAGLIASRRIDTFNEQQILPDFLTDFFVALLGYTRPAFSREAQPSAMFPACAMQFSPYSAISTATTKSSSLWKAKDRATRATARLQAAPCRPSTKAGATPSI
jgi:hypothetical protein